MLWSRLIASPLLVAYGWCSFINAPVLTLGAAICLVALWLRWSWARWAGLGLALGGILAHGEEALYYTPVRTREVLALASSVALFLLLVVARRKMAEAFEARAGWGAEDRRPHIAFLLLLALAGFMHEHIFVVPAFVLGAWAVYRRWSWARFYVLAVGVAGLVGHLGLWALAAMHPKVELVSIGQAWSPYSVCLAILEQVTLPLLFTLLLGSMLGPSMGDEYEAKVGWHSCTWRERVLGLAIICSGGIVAMLVPQLRVMPPTTVSLPLVLVLVATLGGAVLSFRRKTIGLLLLGGAGLAALLLGLKGGAILLHEVQANPDPAFGCFTARGFYFRAMLTTAMTIAGLVCGAATALMALAAFVGPMFRFLLRRS
jgi:hypothetical protein